MNELVLSGPLLLAAALAALAGLVSFASPCVLPLVPGFLGYVGGMTPAGARRAGAPTGSPPATATGTSAGAAPTLTLDSAAATTDPSGRGRLMLGAVLFVLGFTAVFLAMSVVISGLGLALTRHQGLLLQVAGAVVVILGLVMVLQPGWRGLRCWEWPSGSASRPAPGRRSWPSRRWAPRSSPGRTR